MKNLNLTTTILCVYIFFASILGNALIAQNSTLDTDNDGIPDITDLDNDNDGISDIANVSIVQVIFLPTILLVLCVKTSTGSSTS